MRPQGAGAFRRSADSQAVDPQRRLTDPTGTLPQVPTPRSRAMPFDHAHRVSASGPLPISVAPLTGRVTLPSSMR